MLRILVLGVCLTLLSQSMSSAGLPSKAAQELAEYLIGKGGKEATEIGLEALSKKIETLAVKYGDDALVAIKKAGPKALRVVEEAGEHGQQAIKLMARSGDDAVWVVVKKNRMAIFVKYGDDAADAMIKHGEIAEPLIESIGKPAAGALKAVSPQNGRRLAMMAEEGELKAIGRTDELLDVVSKYGDRAMDFIWRNKGTLTVATALTAFIISPEPFLDGTADITKTLAENIVKPLASIPGNVAVEAAKHTNWTWLLSLVAVVAGAVVSLTVWLRHRKLDLNVISEATAIPSNANSSLPFSAQRRS